VWFPNHTQEKTRPTLDKVVEALKAEGVTSFAATGYCFGGAFCSLMTRSRDHINLDLIGDLGRYVFDLAFDNIIKVAAVSHPSLLKVPEDLEVRLSISRPSHLPFYLLPFRSPVTHSPTSLFSFAFSCHVVHKSYLKP